MAHKMFDVWVVGDDDGPAMDIYPFATQADASKAARDRAQQFGQVSTVWRVLMCERFVPTVTVEHEQVGECPCKP